MRFQNIVRLIKHTGKLLEEKQEKLCIKVLQTLKEMMSFEMELGSKVFSIYWYFPEIVRPIHRFIAVMV